MTKDKKPNEIVAIPEADMKTFKRGLVLFVVYITAYALFTIAGTVRKEILMIRVFGVNLGIVSIPLSFIVTFGVSMSQKK